MGGRPSERALHFFPELLALSRLLERQQERYVEGALGITYPQFSLLRDAQANPQATLRELSRLLECSPANVSALVRRLERLGLVRRSPSDEDHRIVTLTLTPQGLDSASPTLLLPLYEFWASAIPAGGEDSLDLFFRQLKSVAAMDPPSPS